MSLPVGKRVPIMCLTQDGLPWSHVDQARRLCAGGARWIQLRMKDASASVWLATAQELGAICREFGATFIVNDALEIAIASGADGVHLGKTDLDWREARRKLGPHRILGGTINNCDDATRARQADCLDYVGVGPWKFTANKKNLAPILGREGVQRLVQELGEMPTWVIGGIESDDLAEVRATGACGVAVSSALYRAGNLEANFQRFQDAWRKDSVPVVASSASTQVRRPSRPRDGGVSDQPKTLSTLL